MKKLARKDLKDYGCLVVCLLSHGIENAILCYDGKYVNINKLKYEFSLNKCPSLYGKPKIFIVQACQGKLRQNNTGIEKRERKRKAPNIAAAISTVQMTHSETQGNYDKDTIRKILKELYINDDATRNPPIMDFLTIKSTIPGFVSYRTSSGSPFIQGLCQVLTREYNREREREQTEHLESVLKKVQQSVNGAIGSTAKQQTVMWEAFLSKNIQFQQDVRGVRWSKP